VRLVRNAAQAVLSAKRPAIAALALALGVAVGGCGGGHKPASPATSTPSAAAQQAQVRFSYLQDADCALWRTLPAANRSELLSGFKSFFSARVDEADTSGQRGTALTSARATQVFNSYCRLPFATKFKLYKIYGRAAAFTTPQQASP
jgi:hypothetical protein